MVSEAESSLITSCLNGSRSAQKAVYSKYCDAMYNVCYRLMGSVPDAEDALQEAFVYVFKNLSSFRGESTLGAWIKRIVVNHCINLIKKRKITFEEMKDHYADHMPFNPEEEDNMEYDVKRVRHAIMKLPDGYRQVLTLYLLEGYDHAEIAHILGIQETGSKSQYSRARTKLREILKLEKS